MQRDVHIVMLDMFFTEFSVYKIHSSSFCEQHAETNKLKLL